jgi:hypothetical protein
MAGLAIFLFLCESLMPQWAARSCILGGTVFDTAR